MELELAWLFISAGLLIGTVIVREMFMWFRNLIPKSVQCWFCQHKTEVPYSLSNNWHCPKCEQYNGFTQDGDYNAVIQQQFEEKLNFSISTLGRAKGDWKQGVNSLCKDCNRNQQLRVEQLAAFVPINEKNYDMEIEHFRTQIDKVYKLCAACEHLLHSVLKKEREAYCVPRRLNAGIVNKATKGTGTLFVNILLSLSLIAVGFIQTGLASNLKRSFRPQVLSSLKKLSPSAYFYASSVSPSLVKSAAIVLSDYVILGGAVICLIAYYRTGRQPVVLLFNALAWLVYLVLSLAYENYIAWFPTCQIVLGAVSSVLSVVVLRDVYCEVREYQQKQQSFLVPRMPKMTRTMNTMNTSPKYNRPQGTSTPRGTPPQSFSYVDSGTRFVDNISTRRSPKDIGLEPGIQGLHLGPANKVANRSSDDDTQSFYNGLGGTLSTSFLHPNSPTWTTYSSAPTVSAHTLPASFTPGGLSHIYSANSVYINPSSRPTSPQSATSLVMSPAHNGSFSDYNLRRRNYSRSIVAAPSLR